MRRSTRKPRLNQDENRWTKSASTAREIVRGAPCASSSCSRMRTSAAVPPGARLSRRNSSCRRGSAAWCTSAAVSSVGLALPGLDRRSHARAVGAEALRQRLEKSDARTDGELGIAGEDFARQRHAGGFAAARQQVLAQLDEICRARSPRRSRACASDRAACARDRRWSAACRRKRARSSRSSGFQRSGCPSIFATGGTLTSINQNCTRFGADFQVVLPSPHQL